MESVIFYSEHQIQQAAKDVAKKLGGDTHKTELELLTKALNLKQESSDPVSVSKEEGKSLDLRFSNHSHLIIENFAHTHS